MEKLNKEQLKVKKKGLENELKNLKNDKKNMAAGKKAYKIKFLSNVEENQKNRNNHRSKQDHLVYIKDYIVILPLTRQNFQMMMPL